MAVGKMMVLQPVGQIYVSLLVSAALLRQAHRIMKCNYHMEIVFLFSFLLANIGVHGSVAIQPKINISVNKSSDQCWQYLLTLMEVPEHLVKSARLSVHLGKCNSKVKPVSYRLGMFIYLF